MASSQRVHITSGYHQAVVNRDGCLSRQKLVGVISNEGRYRKAFENQVRYWSLRQGCWAYADFTFITNADGIQGKNISLKELMAEKGITRQEQLDCIVENLERPIKASDEKERFYRYAHNGDIPKCRKYHEKLTKRMGDDLDAMMFDDKIPICAIDNRINGGRDEIHSRDEAVRQFAEEVKASHEQREKIIELLVANQTTWSDDYKQQKKDRKKMKKTKGKGKGGKAKGGKRK